MKILWRYIIKEIFWPFLFGLVVVTFVLIMDFILDIMNMIIVKGLSAPVILEVFVLNLAWMLALSIPMAVLVAALMGFGRLSADSEIIALKSCKVSFLKLIKPALLISLLLTIFLVWFNDHVLPEANHRARLLITDITRKKPAWNLEENIFLDYFKGYHILVKSVDNKTSKISDITIFEHKNAKAPRTITAKKGDIKFSPDGSKLIMNLYDGEIHEPDPDSPERYRRVEFKRQVLTIEGASSELVRSASGTRGDREMPVKMMLDENKKYRLKIQRSETKIDSLLRNELDRLLYISRDRSKYARTFDRNIIGKAPSIRIKDILSRIEYEMRSIKTYKRQINSRNVEINKKFSIPVACIAFMLLGAPLGVMTRKGGMATSLGLSLFFFIIYWAFLIGGEELADRMFISGALAMWLPNIIIGGTGIILIYLVIKYSTIEGFDIIRKILPGPQK